MPSPEDNEMVREFRSLVNAMIELLTLVRDRQIRPDRALEIVNKYTEVVEQAKRDMVGNPNAELLEPMVQLFDKVRKDLQTFIQ